jgi:PhnB protein
MRIGDTVIMLSDETDNGAPTKSPQSVGDVVTAIMATYWDDVDAAWQRAPATGAEVVLPLADQFYGERVARLRDPIENVPAEDMARRAAAFFNQSG